MYLKEIGGAVCGLGLGLLAMVAPRVSKCVSDTECVTFLYQGGKFDFLPVSQ